MEYVRMTTVAALMGVTAGWMRGLVYQSVMDDERESRAKGSPYVMHVMQCFQALVAHKMRQRNVGYDLIRAAVDTFEIDRLKMHVVPVATGIDLRLHKAVLILEARNLLKRANDLEYGAEDREAA